MLQNKVAMQHDKKIALAPDYEAYRHRKIQLADKRAGDGPEGQA